MLDVAAVAESMWDEVLPPAAGAHIRRDFDLDERPARAWVAFLAGLHDLGKASPPFQAKDADARSRLQGTELGFKSLFFPADPGHGAVTAQHLGRILADGFQIPAIIAKRLATIIGGHHGVFPSSLATRRAEGRTIGEPYKTAGNPWQQARRELAMALGDALGVPTPGPQGEPGNATAMVLAGFVSVADWIGSNEDYFPYASQTDDTRSYLKSTRPKAHDALDRLGWLGCRRPEGASSFADLFEGITDARPLQTEVESLAPQLAKPSLVIIEAPMGEGKTEAAFYLADYWNATASAKGAYVALPTQATSDQMFGRLKHFLSQRYPSDFVNLQLLHGHAALSAERKVMADGTLFTTSGIDSGEGTVAAAEWFTYRKRGLLAPFGVGTIDQALMAVLQVRHGFVRLFGLANEVVMIDEVHAYDTYMSTLLERLLEWLAALGSPVVLLSATLPSRRRRGLASAYLRGLGIDSANATPPAVPVAYPRVSWTEIDGSSHAFRESHVETFDLNRKLRIEKIPADFDVVASRLSNALRDGGCTAVICNTVERAQKMYLALKAHFGGIADDGDPELDLLHARFLFKDRERREQRSLRRFGKPGSGVQRPHRAIVVATQVIEQSLDLDFDLMVSDLAPVDLLLQRAGRLHRHARDSRPRGLGQPVLWAMWPDDDQRGLPQFDPGSKAVYDEHILLRTWLELRRRDAVAIPEDMEDLIERVYADERPCPEWPDSGLRARWDNSFEEVIARRETETYEARERWLLHPSFDGPLYRLARNQLEEDQPDFHKKHQALTRLTGPSVSVLFLYKAARGLVLSPDDARVVEPGRKPGVNQTKALLRNSLTLTSARVVFSLLEQEVPSGWRKSGLLRNHRCVVLDPSGLASVGERHVRVDPELGVVVE